MHLPTKKWNSLKRIHVKVARCEGDARCILGAPNTAKRKKHLNQQKNSLH
ncbi:hypothetical protein HanXRQr2_Chr14g0656461 [Helianthus annuus]|uniref:Uncharacterized protein n=1 Tax=Helianthus annuus TaxID=4232 RepID=A0A9K3H7R0_HELAN|nr:hypothetical protein HanXRQr2_Chr14g0656461 [Helianthus annuus]